MSRYRDLIVGLVFLLGSLIYFILSLFIPQAGVSQVGPEFVPQVVAGLTFVLSVILVFNSLNHLKQLRRVPPEAVEAEPEEVDEEHVPDPEPPRYGPVILTGVLLVAYVLLMEPLGFVIASAAYLFLQFNVSAPRVCRGPRYQLGFALGAVAVAWVVNTIFVDWFYVMLPQGLLG